MPDKGFALFLKNKFLIIWFSQEDCEYMLISFYREETEVQKEWLGQGYIANK